MWISKKTFKELEKRIADLEGQVQGQQRIFKVHIENHQEENRDLHNIFNDIKNSFYQQLNH